MKWYIGRKAGHVNEAFRSAATPTEETHGDRYAVVIGPFRTERGARWAERYGQNNPHFRTVADAEAYAKEECKS